MHKKVYHLPNGFQKEAESMYGWLRNYNLNPKWGNTLDGSYPILLPADEVSCLVMMAEHNPARFGNASEIIKRSNEL